MQIGHTQGTRRARKRVRVRERMQACTHANAANTGQAAGCAEAMSALKKELGQATPPLPFHTHTAHAHAHALVYTRGHTR